MNRLLGLLVILILVSCCKPEEDCIPPRDYIEPQLIDFMPDISYSKLCYKNSHNEHIKFEYTYYSESFLTSPNPCNTLVQSIILSYHNDLDVKGLKYHVSAGGDLAMELEIGDPYGNCFSPFHVMANDTVNYVESLELNGEFYADLQYKATAPVFCATELYYSKVYGLVAFKWKDEWYVLEKDSLQ